MVIILCISLVLLSLGIAFILIYKKETPVQKIKKEIYTELRPLLKAIDGEFKKISVDIDGSKSPRDPMTKCIYDFDVEIVREKYKDAVEKIGQLQEDINTKLATYRKSNENKPNYKDYDTSVSEVEQEFNVFLNNLEDNIIKYDCKLQCETHGTATYDKSKKKCTCKQDGQMVFDKNNLILCLIDYTYFEGLYKKIKTKKSILLDKISAFKTTVNKLTEQDPNCVKGLREVEPTKSMFDEIVNLDNELLIEKEDFVSAYNNAVKNNPPDFWKYKDLYNTYINTGTTDIDRFFSSYVLSHDCAQKCINRGTAKYNPETNECTCYQGVKTFDSDGFVVCNSS